MKTCSLPGWPPMTQRVLAVFLLVLGVTVAPYYWTSPVLASDPPPSVTPPATAAEADARLEASPERDRPLLMYIAGLMHLREGHYSEARSLFERALAIVDARFGKDRNAARARGYFKKERSKTFVGEPYERVMANYYLGILYWMEDGANRARPCFKNALFEDSYVGDEKYASDYVLCEYLEALAAAKAGEAPAQALRRAASITNTVALPSYSPPPLSSPTSEANVLIFVEFGMGPLKVKTGTYREKLTVQAQPSATTAAKLRIDENSFSLPPYDDLFFQAATRGGRAMDHINHGKAVFKTTSTVVGLAALTGAAANATAHGDKRVTWGLAGAGGGRLGGFFALSVFPFCLFP